MVGRGGSFRRRYPEPVKERFRKMQGDLPYKVTLVEVSGHYYVYKLVSELNESTGRYRLRRGRCIGKITEQGVYVPSKIRSELDIETAKAVILANGGKVTMPREKQQTFDYNGIQLTEQEERILTCLSMNARLTAPQIGRIVGMTPERVASKIKHLENQLGIRYVADIRLDPLGYSQFLILVKFQGERPNPKLLKEELEKEPYVLFAALTSGRFDLIMIITAKAGREAIVETFNLNKLKSLRGVTAEWFTSTFPSYRVVPLKENTYELVRTDIWHRTKEHLKPGVNQITDNEFLFLKEFNRNPTGTITKLEANCGLSNGMGRYILDKLRQRGIINTTTITMRKMGIKYDACILLSIVNEELFAAARSSLLEYIITEQNGYITNQFSLVGDFSTPRGVAMFLPVKQNGDLEKAIEEISTSVKGIEIKTLILSQILVGGQLYRRFDNAYSTQCERLAVSYKVEKYINVLNKRQDYLLANTKISI